MTLIKLRKEFNIMVKKKDTDKVIPYSRLQGKTFEEFKSWFMAFAEGFGAKGTPPTDARLHELWEKYNAAVEKFNRKNEDQNQ